MKARVHPRTKQLCSNTLLTSLLTFSKSETIAEGEPSVSELEAFFWKRGQDINKV